MGIQGAQRLNALNGSTGFRVRQTDLLESQLLGCGVALGKSLNLTKIQVCQLKMSTAIVPNSLISEIEMIQVKQFVHLTHGKTTINGSNNGDDE